MIVLRDIKDNVREYESECRGRNKERKEVFDIPVSFSFSISKKSDIYDQISVDSQCIYYNTKIHGCKAAHPHSGNSNCPYCPYSFDLPCGESFLREHKDKIANKNLAEIASEEDSLLNRHKHLFE